MKKLAWIVNLTNIGVLTILIANGVSPIYGAIACGVAVLTILGVVVPEALTLKEVYNDEEV